MRSPSPLLAALLAISLVFYPASLLSASGPSDTEVETLAIVVASHSATLGNGIASDGATLYNGDRLVTAPNGGLSLRSGDSMLYMAGSTQVTLHQSPPTAKFSRELATQPPATKVFGMRRSRAAFTVDHRYKSRRRATAAIPQTGKSRSPYQYFFLP
ncbi:MAG TPA: hypothetical protein VHP80_19540 [Candidatus Acidoferrum sp.]|nr:hypothetical protein [Candidatus Acidoferrum sp.]